MGLIIPTFADPFSLAMQERLEEIETKQTEYVDHKTRLAEARKGVVETIDGTELLDTSMTWDYSPGWEKRRLKYTKMLRAHRIPFRPSVRVRMPGGGVQNVYEGDHVDLAWFEKGLCCVRCCHWKSEDAATHKREHEELQSRLNISPPSDVPLRDLCSNCGARLDAQKYRTKEAA